MNSLPTDLKIRVAEYLPWLDRETLSCAIPTWRSLRRNYRLLLTDLLDNRPLSILRMSIVFNNTQNFHAIKKVVNKIVKAKLENSVLDFKPVISRKKLEIVLKVYIESVSPLRHAWSRDFDDALQLELAFRDSLLSYKDEAIELFYHHIEQLKEKGLDVNGEYFERPSALFQAAYHTSEICIRALVKAGADVNKKRLYSTHNNRDMLQPIDQIVLPKQIMRFIPFGTTVWSPGRAYYSSSEAIKCFQALVELGANPNSISVETGKPPPLFNAAGEGLEAETRALVELGADVNIQIVYKDSNTGYNDVALTASQLARNNRHNAIGAYLESLEIRPSLPAPTMAEPSESKIEEIIEESVPSLSSSQPAAELVVRQEPRHEEVREIPVPEAIEVKRSVPFPEIVMRSEPQPALLERCFSSIWNACKKCVHLIIDCFKSLFRIRS